MDLYIDGSGVTVFDRDTGLPVATFKRTLEKGIDGRVEARRYVGARLVAEATQELLRAIANDDAGAVLGAAHLAQQAMDQAALPFDVEDHQALAVLAKKAEAQAAPATDNSADTPPKPAKRTRK